MALQYVGGATASSINNATMTLDLTALNGGISSTAATGDIVIVGHSKGATNTSGTLSLGTSGYTSLGRLTSTDSYDTVSYAYYKIMGATPDTSLVANGSGNNFDGTTCVVHVWRGVDTTTPLDVTTTTATGINGVRPTPPAITPSTAGSVIICIGAGGEISSMDANFSASDLSNMQSTWVDDSYSSIQGIASYAWSSGTFTPASWSGGRTTSLASWTAFTLALRASANAPTVTTQAVTSIASTTATGNGNITATGGVNAYQRGVATVPASSGDITFGSISDPSFETAAWGGAGTLTQSTTQKKYGSYSMNVAWASGSEAYGEIHPTVTPYEGKTVTFGCWVWSSVASMACLNIYDNQGSGYEANQSSYHTGDSTWQFLTVTRTIRSSLIDLIFRCRIATGSSNSAYYDGIIIAISPNTTAPTLTFDSGDYGTGAFTTSLTGLTSNVAYRATAFATNPVGTSYGSTVGFTTQPTPPTVTTQAVTSITSDSAVGNGNITSIGSFNATKRGFCIIAGSSGDPVVEDGGVVEVGDFGTGAFSLTIE